MRILAFIAEAAAVRTIFSRTWASRACPRAWHRCMARRCA